MNLSAFLFYNFTFVPFLSDLKISGPHLLLIILDMQTVRNNVFNLKFELNNFGNLFKPTLCDMFMGHREEKMYKTL